ncbi:hypothetical protein D8I24_2883 (plasmid) [Cupriavidus necator H850]|uniref:hypothetical protein n=1 Tax=Cupriavidus necator TaxID=106590 RepID=UPI00129EF685|nr:hypothetical protein [Cupriavidus necator]KAI3603551.1 hypothetical protein D8I24_2883 [Cupriavidus necator H850]
MADQKQYPDTDPRHHALKIKAMLNDTLQHMRMDVARVDDPKAKALFETSAEVLNGLVAAYEHFEQRSEPGWQ